MADFKGFENALKHAALEFKKISRSSTIKLISNLDADGITSASIMVRVVERENFSYSLTILHQLKENHAKDLASEDYDFFIFCDLGSGQLKSINRHFHGKKVLVLDHHEIQGAPGDFVTHINPHDYGFDGSGEISAAGVAFFFARAVDPKNDDLSHLAIIGAIGDVQEKNGFRGLNSKILDIAVASKKIIVETDLKLFGLETRPLNKLLMYSSDLEIPGATSTESSVVQFLQSCGIHPLNKKKSWKRYGDLSDNEKKKLASGIIMARQNAGIRNPDDIFSNRYILAEEKSGEFRDAKEFSTLLNSCGRMDNSGLGIGACLGDERVRKKALASRKEYKRTLIDSMDWYNRNRDVSEKVIRGKNYIILNAGTEVMATVIGTIASMITKNNEIAKNTFLLSMARNNDNTTKISLRISGNPPGVDLKELISDIAKSVGGEAGGHQYAAGAIINTGKEEEFIAKAKEILSKQNL